MSSAEIAASARVNPVTVRKAIQVLHKAGLVYTLPGRNGGAALAKPVNQILLVEVYDLVQQEEQHLLSTHSPNPNCPVGRGVAHYLEGLRHDFEQVVRAELGNRTIADVLEEVIRGQKQSA